MSRVFMLVVFFSPSLCVCLFFFWLYQVYARVHNFPNSFLFIWSIKSAFQLFFHFLLLNIPGDDVVYIYIHIERIFLCTSFHFHFKFNLIHLRLWLASELCATTFYYKTLYFCSIQCRMRALTQKYYYFGSVRNSISLLGVEYRTYSRTWSDKSIKKKPIENKKNKRKQTKIK